MDPLNLRRAVAAAYEWQGRAVEVDELLERTDRALVDHELGEVSP